MSLEKELTRWIFASVSEHFKGFTDGFSRQLFIEGQQRPLEPESILFELRMDGPWLTELSRNYWDIYIEINLGIQVALDDQDYHTIYTVIGEGTTIYTPTISTFRRGNGGADDDSFIGCLILEQNKRSGERIQVNNFGKIAPDKNLLQATIEGHYRMKLSE